MLLLHTHTLTLAQELRNCGAASQVYLINCPLSDHPPASDTSEDGVSPRTCRVRAAAGRWWWWCRACSTLWGCCAVPWWPGLWPWGSQSARYRPRIDETLCEPQISWNDEWCRIHLQGWKKNQLIMTNISSDKAKKKTKNYTFTRKDIRRVSLDVLVFFITAPVSWNF